MLRRLACQQGPVQVPNSHSQGIYKGPKSVERIWELTCLVPGMKERKTNACPSALATSMSPLSCFLLLVPPPTPKLEWSHRKGDTSCVPHSTPPQFPSILGDPKERQVKNQGEDHQELGGKPGSQILGGLESWAGKKWR